MVTETASESDAENRLRYWHADLAMLSVAAIWGVNMPIMKHALTRVDEFLFNAMRLLISAIILGVVVVIRKEKIIDYRSQELSVGRQWLLILLFAFLSGFLYQILFLLGIDATTAGNTALIMSSLPMWTAVLALVLISERITGRAWLGLSLALLGTLVVTLTVPNSQLGEGSLTGNFLVAAATVAWALGSVASRPLMRVVSPIGLAFCGVGIAVPLHFLVARNAWGQLHRFVDDPVLFASVLFSGGFSTGIAYAFWNYGVKVLGTSQAAIFQNLVPFFAILASWLMLGEIPTAIQIVGGFVILFGLVVMRNSR